MSPEAAFVLIVESDEDARELLACVLERAGMAVRLAASVAEAHGILRSSSPLLIVSSIKLADGDGYAFMRSVRGAERAAIRAIPAIALTGFATADDKARALRAGFNIHMPKPLELPRFLRAVRESVGLDQPS